MRDKRHFTSFYVETLILVLVFMLIILVLTRVFGAARTMSADAADLSQAVRIAENIAESVSSRNNGDVNPLSSAYVTPLPQSQRYDDTMRPAADGEYLAEVSYEYDGMVTVCHIEISRGGRSIYTLDTAVEGGAG